MLFPLRDEIKTRHVPIATYTLIALNVASWVLLQGIGFDPALTESVCRFGLVPGDLLGNIVPGQSLRMSETMVCRFDGSTDLTTLVTSMFMHGGWMHIIGNMWFLYVFGDNIEDVMGPVRFVIFYLLSGLIAAASQISTDPSSVVPMVGASGAIGGVMGAYAYLYPRVRVHTLLFLGFFFTTIDVPAIFMLGWWFVLQLLSGLPALGESTGGVAFWAHVGGFLGGLLMITLFKRDRPDPPRQIRL